MLNSSNTAVGVCRSIKTNNAVQQMLHFNARNNSTKTHVAPEAMPKLSYILDILKAAFATFHRQKKLCTDTFCCLVISVSADKVNR